VMIIYVLTCRTTGKSYVGQTIDPLDVRWGEHVGCSSRGQTLLYRAIRKYGPDAFERRVIEECNASILDDRERHWIAELKTLKPNGYNMTVGGQGTRGHKHTEETKQHLSKVHKGRIVSAETREKMRISATGRKLSDEAKRKCSEASKHRVYKPHPPGCSCHMHLTGILRRLLTQQDVQLALEWYSAGSVTWKQIAEKLGVSNSTLQRAIKRHGDQTGLDSAKKSL
jgi:group I intron endonuclease